MSSPGRYYSVENVREAVSSYFAQYGRGRKASAGQSERARPNVGFWLGGEYPLVAQGFIMTEVLAFVVAKVRFTNTGIAT